MVRHPLTRRFVRQVKARLLQMHLDAGVGHIGGNLSAIDILLCLYHRILGDDDRFILSKGHAAGALYATLWSVGLLNEPDLQSFHKDDTRLSGHPPVRAIEAIPFATGSLGHGLGLAAGMALAKRLSQKPGHVYCLTSDGEWNEGSAWESLIFSQHQKLANLTYLVDLNGLQGFGSTKEVADLDPLAEKFRAFGLPTKEVDGHDLTALAEALTPPPALAAPVASPAPAGPRIIVARTRKGCGVSFMEGKMEWHYRPLTRELFDQAVAELAAGAEEDG